LIKHVIERHLIQREVSAGGGMMIGSLNQSPFHHVFAFTDVTSVSVVPNVILYSGDDLPKLARRCHFRVANNDRVGPVPRASMSVAMKDCELVGTMTSETFAGQARDVLCRHPKLSATPSRVLMEPASLAPTISVDDQQWKSKGTGCRDR